MKREELAAFLKRYASPAEREHGHLVPVMAELYQAGLTVRQLAALFPVGKKFIRKHLPEVEGFRWRVEAILKKHGIKLEDLPGPSATGKKK